MNKHAKTKSFASRWGFILASVGSAVGMANVWGFPNKMGANGGGAFLLIYLLFVFIFSYVGLPAEFAMGRRAATGTLGAYQNAWATRGKNMGKAGGVLGWLNTVTVENVHPNTTVALRMNGISGDAGSLKLYAYGTDGTLQEVPGELWQIRTEDGTTPETLLADTLYEVHVTVADGGSFDLDEKEREITVSAVLGR